MIRDKALPDDTRRVTSASVGEPAPEFSLSDPEGATWRLSERRGSVIALLFYPGDETLVCTRQLCSVRDRWDDYLATGAEVVGISPGSHDVHRRFAARHALPLRLLADEGRHVTSQYGAHRLFPVWSTRALVVIDAQGFIRYRNVMLRAFRPSDARVLTAIRLAQYDELIARH